MRCGIVVICLCSVFALVARPASADDGVARRILAMNARLNQSDDCDLFVDEVFKLRASTPAQTAALEALRQRVAARKCKLPHGPPGPPDPPDKPSAGTPPPRPLPPRPRPPPAPKPDLFAAYETLERRAHVCLAARCQDLDLVRKVLVGAALDLIRSLPRSDPRLDQILTRLSFVTGQATLVEEVSDPRIAEARFQRLRQSPPELLRLASEISELTEHASPAEIANALTATFALLQKFFPDFLRRHAELEAGVKATGANASKSSVVAFARLLSRALGQEAELLRSRRNDAHTVPVQYRRLAILGAMEHCTSEQRAGCEEVENFSLSFFQELMRQSPQGLTTIQRVNDGDQLMRRVTAELNRQQGACTPAHDPVCQGPYLGAVLLRVRPHDQGGYEGSVSCQLRSLNESFESVDEVRIEFSSDPAKQVSAGTQFAIDATRKCRVIGLAGKQLVLEPDAAPATRVSGWNAAYFAGAPFLLDPQAPPASKVVFSALDALTLVASVVGVLGAVHTHNVAAQSESDDLFLRIGVASFAANIVIKAGGGVCYAFIGGCGQRAVR
jgi:hypothetical protein